MFRVHRGIWFLAVLCLWGTGCAAPPVARYVYQDGEYGVVGIPSNTPLGKKDFRQQADELMLRHFPEGFEIVRAEEVVNGERILDTAIKKELDTEPGFVALNQALKLGKFAQSSSLDQKDTTKITESRIIYRRKDPSRPPGHDGYATLVNATPEFYIDPNEQARRMEKEMLLAASKKPDDKKVADAKPDDKHSKLADAKPKDDAVQQAGGVKAN